MTPNPACHERLNEPLVSLIARLKSIKGLSDSKVKGAFSRKYPVSLTFREGTFYADQRSQTYINNNFEAICLHFEGFIASNCKEHKNFCTAERIKSERIHSSIEVPKSEILSHETEDEDTDIEDITDEVLYQAVLTYLKSSTTDELNDYTLRSSLRATFPHHRHMDYFWILSRMRKEGILGPDNLGICKILLPRNPRSQSSNAGVSWIVVLLAVVVLVIGIASLLFLDEAQSSILGIIAAILLGSVTIGFLWQAFLNHGPDVNITTLRGLYMGQSLKNQHHILDELHDINKTLHHRDRDLDI